MQQFIIWTTVIMTMHNIRIFGVINPPPSDSCIKMGSDESHFNVSVGSDGQSHKTVSTNHSLFEEKGEPKRYRTVSNRGPSAYQHNALPLGQTGSLPSFSYKGSYYTLSVFADKHGGNRSGGPYSPNYCNHVDSTTVKISQCIKRHRNITHGVRRSSTSAFLI